MSGDFVKYPSTPHIPYRGNKGIRGEKILGSDDLRILLSNPVTIEEKIDGANLGISVGASGEWCFQNRGTYLSPPYLPQWKELPKWIEKKQELIFDVIEDHFILFGEWCYAKHSIAYKQLPDWFIGFDIYDKKNYRFLSVHKRNTLLDKMGISIVPQLYHGIFQLNDIPRIMGKSAYSDAQSEGLYFRYDGENWLDIRAKYVREDFLQSDEIHWKQKSLEKNALMNINNQ